MAITLGLFGDPVVTFYNGDSVVTFHNEVALQVDGCS